MTTAKTQQLLSLTAVSLMSRDLLLLPEQTSLRAAACLLIQNQVGGAPVIDAGGRYVGVFSAFDVLKIGKCSDGLKKAEHRELPVTCSFQEKHHDSHGVETTTCVLPRGACPIQRMQLDRDGQDILVCKQPHCVFSDWQIVKVESLPSEEVRQYMTADPVTVLPSSRIAALAQMMVDAHVHRLIVVDDMQRPIGVVSSTDVLAAVARAEIEDAS